MNFSDFEAHKTFGRFNVTIDTEENRADVWVGANVDKGTPVNLEYIIADVETGEPDEDAIVEAVYKSGYRDQIINWVHSTGLY